MHTLSNKQDLSIGERMIGRIDAYAETHALTRKLLLLFRALYYSTRLQFSEPGVPVTARSIWNKYLCLTQDHEHVADRNAAAQELVIPSLYSQIAADFNGTLQTPDATDELPHLPKPYVALVTLTPIVNDNVLIDAANQRYDESSSTVQQFSTPAEKAQLAAQLKEQATKHIAVPLIWGIGSTSSDADGTIILTTPDNVREKEQLRNLWYILQPFTEFQTMDRATGNDTQDKEHLARNWSNEYIQMWKRHREYSYASKIDAINSENVLETIFRKMLECYRQYDHWENDDYEAVHVLNQIGWRLKNMLFCKRQLVRLYSGEKEHYGISDVTENDIQRAREIYRELVNLLNDTGLVKIDEGLLNLDYLVALLPREGSMEVSTEGNVSLANQGLVNYTGELRIVPIELYDESGYPLKRLMLDEQIDAITPKNVWTRRPCLPGPEELNQLF